jgi:hypothetical protein
MVPLSVLERCTLYSGILRGAAGPAGRSSASIWGADLGHAGIVETGCIWCKEWVVVG